MGVSITLCVALWGNVQQQGQVRRSVGYDRNQYISRLQCIQSAVVR